MGKQTLNLDNLVNPDPRPTAGDLPQRGQATPTAKKRLSLVLDNSTYRRLRLHAADRGQTHQEILHRALNAYLESVHA